MIKQHRLVISTLLATAVAVGLQPAMPRGATVKFYQDDPLQREPETQDASKVREWDGRSLLGACAKPHRQSWHANADREGCGCEHDRRGSELELVLNRIGTEPLSIEVVRGC
jgi:hypothetical protein